MSEKVISNRNIQVCAKVLILALLFFGATVYLNFATDSYWLFTSSFEVLAKDMLVRNGRPVIALIYWIASALGISAETFFYISSFLSIVFLAISVWVLQKVLKRCIESENLRILISFVSVANIFIIEYFMFIEKCGFILSILFDMMGVYFIDQFMRTRDRKSVIVTIFFIAMAFLTYPSTVALFVIISMAFVFLNSDDFKRYFINTGAVIISYALPVGLYYIVLKFLINSDRVSSENNIFYNIGKAGYIAISQFIKTYDILPHGYYAALTVVIMVVCVVIAIRSKKRFLFLVHLILQILFTFIFSMASIIQGSGWSVMRIVYPIASIFGVLLILVMSSKSDLKHLPKIAYVVSILLLSAQCISFNKVYIDKYRLNYADRLRYEYIGQAITEYQESSGNTITSIAFYEDRFSESVQYPDLYSTGDSVVSAFTTDWSKCTALNYYLHTSYGVSECIEEYEDYFASHDWNVLSKEQLIFDGNTLHLCVY